MPEGARVAVEPARDSGRVAFRSAQPTTRAFAPVADEALVATTARDGDVVRLRDGDVLKLKTALPAPLFVLDGEPLPAETAQATVDALSPDVIARVDVLKGDAAVQRYGARGRGGAVLVTSRR